MSNVTDLLYAISGSEVTAFLLTCAWILKKLNAHDVALGILIQEVNPPSGKSLRELLTDIRLRQAESDGLLKSKTTTTQTESHYE